MPSLVSLRSLKVTAPDGTPLFDDLTITFGPQRYGLVGRNGCGKSTLLRVLGREMDPAAGTVSLAGTIGWMRQEFGTQRGSVAQALDIADDLSRLDRLLRGDGSLDDAAAVDWTLQERLDGALDRVGMAATDPWRPLETLSGGERTRIAIARVLLSAPDILLLDEPTNNLDVEGRALVADLLRDWRGCVIVASHDRALLENVDAILDIANGRASLFGGAWPEFAAARLARLDAARASLEQAERDNRRVAAAAQRQRERQARRDSRGRSDRARGDAPKTLFDARQDWAERTAGRGNRIAERQSAAAASALAEARAAVEVLAPLQIDLPEPSRSGAGPVLALESVTFDADGRRILGPLDLVLQRAERLAITGANGTGKTTLLRLAAGMIAPTSGEVSRATGPIALLDQHVDFLTEEETLVDAMRRMNPALLLNEARAALARFAFRNVAAEKPCGALSGGERMRAGLACVLSAPEPPVLLLLDEPTNHMDVDSVEVLEAGLRGYGGALVVVSHDRWFLHEIGVTRDITLDLPDQSDHVRSAESPPAAKNGEV